MKNDLRDILEFKDKEHYVNFVINAIVGKMVMDTIYFLYFGDGWSI